MNHLIGALEHFPIIRQRAAAVFKTKPPSRKCVQQPIQRPFPNVSAYATKL